MTAPYERTVIEKVLPKLESARTELRDLGGEARLIAGDILSAILILREALE